ncbi:DUF2326 domain-containing protein [Flammeovirga yaeyamensis]|uniref:DUF2326 domain-containing protein n=1 Tax=Flammeovirga yaeyamensis TaxID=367791 RepID=A0AAX1N955_9BACT|nr:DUF2326 domain-containing protein [Flammeovirga yaeyamensis]MBB3699500.1 uncharacterized protein YydD (DUF2326 family) [Flammeovirga yaeyamensis]NMF35243.1 DUF2326 domain-containing protein [Flammeovirga yaeyamensis]QWG04104.1 DUF2326 domain-containing protein [Flammeovirga yaeyamensis]
MIRFKKLYSIPKFFEPIKFESGLNIILGEKSEGNNKTNGVGKTMAIEFLNFCLLKKSSDSRVTLIPDHILDIDTVVYLDINIYTDFLTIARSIKKPDVVTIFKNGVEIISNESIEIASEYLGNLYFREFPLHITRISFRNLLNPIIRDERSEFKDIIQCFDTAKRIPSDYKPHLFFLNLNIELYSEIKKVIDELTKKTTFVTETKKLITSDYNKVSEAKARLNELEGEVSKINTSIEKLKTNESFESIQDDLVKLESRLSKLRIRQKTLKLEIKQINSLPEPENISENEITILFNQFKDGLGDMVEKSLQEVKEFKTRIDSFKNSLINNKLKMLQSELISLNTKIQRLDDEYSEKISLLDNGELLKDLKTSINIFNKKNQELNNLRSVIDRYNKAEKEKKSLKNTKDNKIIDFDDHLSDKQVEIKEFEETILYIHENIMGNRNAHFGIETINSAKAKEFLSFDFRINDDGSWSTNRMKVFIYDLALLLSDSTKKNHPKLLVHDNLFNVDNDSLEKSLNFLHKQSENHPEEFQYILTLNRDMVEIMEERNLIEFNISDYARAKFTKNDRFLKVKYSELSKRKK